MSGRPSAAIDAIAISIGACGGSAPEGSGAKSGSAPATGSASASEACKLLSQAEIADAVGNPVNPGQPFAGPEVCKWDTDQPGHVTVLLTVRPKGSMREQVLCRDFGKEEGATPVAGVGTVATWKFSSMGTLFNSGDLESCGAGGFLSLSLNGKRDEDSLKRAAVGIAQKVFGRI